MSAVDVGIGHDYHLVVGKFRQVRGLWIVLGADSHTQGAEEAGDFLVVENLVVHSLLHIENLTSQG